MKQTLLSTAILLLSITAHATTPVDVEIVYHGLQNSESFCGLKMSFRTHPGRQTISNELKISGEKISLTLGSAVINGKLGWTQCHEGVEGQIVCSESPGRLSGTGCESSSLTFTKDSLTLIKETWSTQNSDTCDDPRTGMISISQKEICLL